MAEMGAPGQQPAQSEPPPCYNCGMRGHMFMACPEPTRAIPAGLEASRARQQHGGSDRSELDPSKQHRGPVVTRYNQPPKPGPVITRYGPPPPGTQQNPYSSPQNYPLPNAHQQYPPAYGTGYPPSQAPPYNKYGMPGPPGLQSYGQFPLPYGPPGYPGAPGQYPPGLPPQGGPPYPPPPGSFSPQQPYGYQGPPPQTYPHSNYGPFAGQPPPTYPPYLPIGGQNSQTPYRLERGPAYSDDGRDSYRGDNYPRERNDSRRGNYQGNNNRRGRDNHRPDRYNDCDGHNGRESEGQRNPDRYGIERRRDRREQRDNRNNRGRRDRRDHQHRFRSRSPSGSTHSNNRTSRPAPNTPSQATPSEPGITATPTIPETEEASVDAGAKEPAGVAQVKSKDRKEKAVTHVSEEDLPYDDYAWDMETIFKEIVPSHLGDPIGEPLPSEYTEDIMLPPSFNATGVKSKYITPQNLDDFAMSVRETDEWKKLKIHPTFLEPEKITPQSLENYYDMTNKRHGQKNGRKDLFEYTQKLERSLNRDQGRNICDHRDPGRKRRRQDSRFRSEAGYDDRNVSCHAGDSGRDEPAAKRPRQMSPEPGEITDSGSVHSGSVQRRSPTYTVDEQVKGRVYFDASHRFSLHNKSPFGEDNDRDYRTLDQYLGDSDFSRYRDDYDYLDPPRRRSSREYRRQDDAWANRETINSNTNKSFRPFDSDASKVTQGAVAAPTSPPLRRLTGRPSSRGSHLGSRPSSRRSSNGHLSQPESVGSPLTPLEAELLGMISSDSDTGEKSPKPSVEDPPAKKRRQTKVDAAYSRRW